MWEKHFLKTDTPFDRAPGAAPGCRILLLTGKPICNIFVNNLLGRCVESS